MINKAREAREAHAEAGRAARLSAGLTPAVKNAVIGFASVHSAITSAAPAPAHNKI